MPCDVKALSGTMLAISMVDLQDTSHMRGGGTTLAGEDEIQLVHLVILEDVRT